LTPSHSPAGAAAALLLPAAAELLLLLAPNVLPVPEKAVYLYIGKAAHHTSWLTACSSTP
jgi:hypothetical protein